MAEQQTQEEQQTQDVSTTLLDGDGTLPAGTTLQQCTLKHGISTPREHITQQGVHQETPTVLTFEQESCFKLQLLKLAVQREVQLFFEKPSNIRHTLFLRFMRQRMLDFPLWAKRANATRMCDELVMSLPELCISSQKATKRDLDNKSIRQLVVKCLDLAMRTPKEMLHDREVAAQNTDWEVEVDEFADEQEKQRTIKLAGTLHQASETFQAILLDVEGKGGYSHLFQVVKTTPHINTLPPLYQRLGKSMSQALAIWVEKEMRDVKQVAKIKRVYRLTPTRAIRAALSIANPMKLMQGLLSVFLARPFGSRNLIQKFSEILVEIKKTEKLLSEASKEADAELKVNIKKTLRKTILKKIPAYINNNYSVYHNEESSGFDDEVMGVEDDVDVCDTDAGGGSGEEERLDKLTPKQLVWRVLVDKDVLPKIDEADIEALHPDQILSLQEVITLQMRYKEKQDFVELLGNQKMLKIVKELLPVIHEPIARLFSKASVGSHFEVLFKTLKRVIKVAELNEENMQQRLTMYERVFDKFIRDLYSFLHNIAANDDHTLEDTLKWVVDLLAFMESDTLDVETLLWPGDISKTEERDDVIAEIDVVVAYRNAMMECEEKEKAMTTTTTHAGQSSAKTEPTNTADRPVCPTLTQIPRIVDNFVQLAATRLRMSKRGSSSFKKSTEFSPAPINTSSTGIVSSPPIL